MGSEMCIRDRHIGWELRSSLVGDTILGVQSEPACKEIPLPALFDHQDKILPRIEPHIADRVVSHTCGPGRKSTHNSKYRIRLQGYGPKSDIEHRADEVAQCHELIAAFRAADGLDNPASHNEPVYVVTVGYENVVNAGVEQQSNRALRNT